MPSSISNFNNYYPCPHWGKPGIIKVLVIFTLFFFLWFSGDRFGALVLKKIGDASKLRYSLLYHGGLKNDFLVFGNSRGIHGFYVPELNEATGLNGMNLSYNALGMETIEVLFRDYLQHNQAPTKLLLEISNLNASQPFALSGFKPYVLQSKQLFKLHRKYYPGANHACSLTHLFCFNSEMYLRILYYLGKKDQSWINHRVMNDTFVQNYNPQAMGYIEYGTYLPENLEALKRIIELCDENKVAIYLIVVPYLPIHIKNLKDYMQWIDQVKAATGQPILDFSDKLENSKYFADPLHLNFNAVHEMDQLLMDTVFNRKKRSSF